MKIILFESDISVCFSQSRFPSVTQKTMDWTRTVSKTFIQVLPCFHVALNWGNRTYGHVRLRDSDQLSWFLKCAHRYHKWTSKAVMLTCERGVYLSTHGSSCSPGADSFRSWDAGASELRDSPVLFLGFLDSALDGKARQPFFCLGGAKLSPGKSAKDWSTQRFS